MMAPTGEFYGTIDFKDVYVGFIDRMLDECDDYDSNYHMPQTLMVLSN
jgi:hypothetical protein